MRCSPKSGWKAQLTHSLKHASRPIGYSECVCLSLVCVCRYRRDEGGLPKAVQVSRWLGHESRMNLGGKKERGEGREKMKEEQNAKHRSTPRQ